MTDDVQREVTQFVAELTELRRLSGQPSLRRMEVLSKRADKRPRLPHSTVGDALTGRRLPPISVVLGIVLACLDSAREDGVEVDHSLFDTIKWQGRWLEVSRLCDEQGGKLAHQPLTESTHLSARCDQRSQEAVGQVARRKWKIRDDEQDDSPRDTLLPVVSYVGIGPAAAAESDGLGQLILSTFVDGSIDITSALGHPLSTVSRAENRTGWQLLSQEAFTYGTATWPVRHRGHRLGYLIWHDDDGRGAGWELAVYQGRWEDDGDLLDIGNRYSRRYLAPPPLKQAGRGGTMWSDPADALLTLADWHYCPRAALYRNDYSLH